MDIEIQHRHSVRHTHCCMAEMVAALAITRDPVDGGTWGKHGGRRKLAVTACLCAFWAPRCERFTSCWRTGLLVISLPDTDAPVCLQCYFALIFAFNRLCSLLFKTEEDGSMWAYGSPRILPPPQRKFFGAPALCSRKLVKLSICAKYARKFRFYGKKNRSKVTP